jgi:hypothetical protein
VRTAEKQRTFEDKRDTKHTQGLSETERKRPPLAAQRHGQQEKYSRRTKEDMFKPDKTQAIKNAKYHKLEARLSPVSVADAAMIFSLL